MVTSYASLYELYYICQCGGFIFKVYGSLGSIKEEFCSMELMSYNEGRPFLLNYTDLLLSLPKFPNLKC